jgi:hypothetical protein
MDVLSAFDDLDDDDLVGLPTLAELEDERGRAEDALDHLGAYHPNSYAITVVEQRLAELTEEIRRLG